MMPQAATLERLERPDTTSGTGRYVGVNDPALAVVDNITNFKAAVTDRKSSAVILPQTMTDEFQTAITKTAQNLRGAAQEKFSFSFANSAARLNDPEHFFEPPVRADLESMAQTYYETTGIDDLVVAVRRDFRTVVHGHQYPVIVKVVDVNDTAASREEGTTLFDRQGRPFTVGLNHLLYIGEERQHSGERKTSERTGMTWTVEPSVRYITTIPCFERNEFDNS
jgi:hypothetical protein